ncbi:MAG: hypothetical protein R3C55_08865 [Parvularculaceae bacterium]
MKGDEGNDTPDGGAGVGSLQGNAGLDVYRFSPDGRSTMSAALRAGPAPPTRSSSSATARRSILMQR